MKTATPPLTRLAMATRSMALLAPLLLPLTNATFSWISANRGRLGWLVAASPCENGACEVPDHAHPRAIYR